MHLNWKHLIRVLQWSVIIFTMMHCRKEWLCFETNIPKMIQLIVSNAFAWILGLLFMREMLLINMFMKSHAFSVWNSVETKVEIYFKVDKLQLHMQLEWNLFWHLYVLHYNAMNNGIHNKWLSAIIIMRIQRVIFNNLSFCLQ